MKRILLASALLLTSCSGSQVTAWLEGNGVSASKATKAGTIVSNVLADGTLMCSLDGIVAAVPSVSVVNATAAAVAGACKVATLISAGVQAQAALVAVPVPPPATPTAVPIAVVPAATVIAVQKSVTPPTAS